MIAKPHLVMKKQGERHLWEYRKPESILKIRTKEQLLATLDHFSKPFIKHTVPDSPLARRRYVEQVRPALRWFCKKFGVNIPSWLQGNAHYDQLSPEEHEQSFGKEPLNVREFEELQQEPADAGTE